MPALPADLLEDEILLRAGEVAAVQQRAATELLELAYAWAVAHPPQRLADSRTRGAVRGGERVVAYGGEGAPEVAEFAAATFGARIGRTTHAGRRLMAAALDLHHRLPLLWSRVRAGEVRDSYAIHVADRTRDLTLAEAAHVDAEVAESADGRIPWSRFERLVEGKIAQAAPAVRREREQRARRATFARRVGLAEAGMASFLIRADEATITRLDHAVTTLAGGIAGSPAEAEALSADEQRVAAIRLLADHALTSVPAGSSSPSQPAPTRAELVIHLTAEGPDIDEQGQPLERVARMEGGDGRHTPVTVTWLREVLGPQAVFTVRPVLHPFGQAPVDAWEIPARHRRAVRVLTEADVFPWGACTSRTMQIDHTTPWHRGGPSGIGNYGPLTTSHHRIKTHSSWQVRQPFPGLYLWRDPHSGTYLVDHTGTRALDPPGRPLPVVEIYRHAPRFTYTAA